MGVQISQHYHIAFLDSFKKFRLIFSLFLPCLLDQVYFHFFLLFADVFSTFLAVSEIHNLFLPFVMLKM